MASGAFGGTIQKCKACEKTVYFVDQLTADGRVYHKACFRCQHCKGTLKLSNYSSIDGVLYCKPHYDQLFKLTGSLDKSFEGSSRSAKADRSNGHESTANRRFSSMFVGTQDKCVVCKKTVYPIEKVAVDGTSYHRPCFKCSHGGCVISPSNYIAHEGRLYCKHHHSQLFMAKGNFSQLEDRHEGITVPSENLPRIQHEGIKVPTENPAPDDNAEKLEDRHEGIKVPTENPAPDDNAEKLEDRHEGIKVPTENPAPDESAESAS